MHGTLTFLLVPSSQIKPATHRQTVVSLLMTGWGGACVRIPVYLHAHNANHDTINPLLRCMYGLTLTTTPPMTPFCRVGSLACHSRKETSCTLSARTTPTGGRPTGTEMKTTSPSLDSFQVRTRTKGIGGDS